jgi:integrase
VLLSCGQRVRETLRIERGEVDLAAMAWVMPAEKTKTKRAQHEVPLPPQAVRVLRLLMATRKGAQLFTIQDTSINRALRRWAEREGVEPFQTRDLRRTWKSRAGDAGVDRFTRDLIQQHAKVSDTGSKHYDHTDYRPQLRQAMARWAWWLRRTVRG